MRVLVVEGQPKVRRALRFFLKEQPNLIPVGELSEVNTLLSQIRATNPDIVLLDWELLGRTPTEWLATLRQASQPVWVVLSHHPDVREIALAAGADGFICKSDPPQMLLAALGCKSN